MAGKVGPFIVKFNHVSLYALLFITASIGAVNGETASELRDILSGGTNVVANEMPWAIGLLDISLGPEIRKLFCGGSILDARHVLTAGRCVTRWLPENETHAAILPTTIRVLAGDVDRMEDEESEQFRGVKDVILHPGFKYDSAYVSSQNSGSTTKGFLNDIAILVVDPPFNFSQGGVSAISLGSTEFYATASSSQNAEGTFMEFRLAGWGITDKRQNTVPTGSVIKQVTLPMHFDRIRKKNEKRAFGLWFNATTSYIQFSSGLGNEDRGLMGRCIGDRGSALTAKGEDGWVQCGIINFGIWCDRYFPTGQILLFSPQQLEWVSGILNPKLWSHITSAVAIACLLSVVAGYIVIVRIRNGGSRSRFL